MTSLLPYLLVAGYGVLLARSGVGYETTPNERGRDQIFAGIAVVYTIFMFVAAGLKYVLLVTVLFAPGTFSMSGRGGSRTRACSRRSNLESSLSSLVGAAIGVYGLATGLITP